MPNRPWFVAIGASGREGLEDIALVLENLPPDLNAIVLVVLHRPADRISHLRSVLAKSSGLPVVLAGDGDRFAAGTCYVGEPNQHLTLAVRSFAELVDDFKGVHRNRTVDLLFNSVAKHGGECTIGVVLSGSLDDGSRGLAAIHAAGGWSMVLTPHTTSKGMPENAIAYDGPIDLIGSALDIAAAVKRIVKGSTGTS